MSNNKPDDNVSFSAPDLWGGITYFNDKGQEIGYSMPDTFGGMVNYDKSGKQIGYSVPDLFGGSAHYDSRGQQIGFSMPDTFGDMVSYDKRGNRVGYSYTNKATGFTYGRNQDNPVQYTPVKKKEQPEEKSINASASETGYSIPEESGGKAMLYFIVFMLIALFIWCAAHL